MAFSGALSGAACYNMINFIVCEGAAGTPVHALCFCIMCSLAFVHTAKGWGTGL